MWTPVSGINHSGWSLVILTTHFFIWSIKIKMAGVNRMYTSSIFTAFHNYKEGNELSGFYFGVNICKECSVVGIAILQLYQLLLLQRFCKPIRHLALTSLRKQRNDHKDPLQPTPPYSCLRHRAGEDKRLSIELSDPTQTMTQSSRSLRRRNKNKLWSSLYQLALYTGSIIISPQNTEPCTSYTYYHMHACMHAHYNYYSLHAYYC